MSAGIIRLHCFSFICALRVLVLSTSLSRIAHNMDVLYLVFFLLHLALCSAGTWLWRCSSVVPYNENKSIVWVSFACLFLVVFGAWLFPHFSRSVTSSFMRVRLLGMIFRRFSLPLPMQAHFSLTFFLCPSFILMTYGSFCTSYASFDVPWLRFIGASFIFVTISSV